MNKQIGFIGLGNMGFGMTANLLKSGYDVFAFDTDEQKLNTLVKIGALKANAVKEIGNSVETVILCLPHPAISLEVIFKQNLLSVGSKVKTIIDTSTLTPEITEEFYQQLKKQRVNFLCTPMLGGKNAAIKRTIHFLVEGDKEISVSYKKLLMSMGNQVDFMGAAPAATLTKLAYNICRYGNVATAVEVTKFLGTYTKDTKAIYNLLVKGSLDNFGQVWKEDIKDMMLEGRPYKPSQIPEKDLTLIVQLAKKKKLSGKLFTAIREVYKALR